MPKKQFKAESKKLLDLMINSIYTHKEIFLREIISNASDAIDKLCYMSLTDENVGLSRANFKIEIALDPSQRKLTVSDNGVGMTRETLEQNLGTIAKSGSGEFKATLENAEDIDIIGQFGVGFYSAFMVSSNVTVLTRAYGSDTAYEWSSNGADGYTIKEAEKETVGTCVTMILKEDDDNEKYSDFCEKWRVTGLVKKYSDYIRYPIILDGETLNSMVPLWQRPKSEVTKEDLDKFYKDKFAASSDYAKVIRVDAEGTVEYKALLFVPQKAPMGYYTTEYKKGLELYSSGVMIMTDCEDLVPECFRFIRGVVDSPSLSLNISREMLQHDKQLRVIAANIEKKIKAALEEMLREDRVRYEEFFTQFGLQIKYGMVSDYGMRAQELKDLLVFHSSRGSYETLKEYVDTMPEAQEYIYYARAASVERAADLPQAEMARDKGYEILYLTDDVDEFVVSILGDFDGKKFKSINDKDTALESEDKKEEVEKQTQETQDVLTFAKETLGSAVTDVRLSHKLKSHPVCLSSDNDVTIEMEKYFATIPNQTEIKAQRVLEINGSHKAFRALCDAFDSDKERAATIVKILYGEACLIADLPIDSPSELANLISEIM
ncbi:MAG: molecular chaperone HtpG [Clostridia bacterium]|nr:molecular chaperone HtpG [Clostridia bacterium]